MLVRTAVILAAAIATLAGPGAKGARAATVGLCGCCIEQMPDACSASCKAMPATPGQCPAFVIYGAKGAVGPDGNPLTAMSLKDLSIGNPDKRQLENLRRFLERNRRRAIRTWKREERKLEHGAISREEFEAADKLYRDALVNYYHGIRAYKIKIGKAVD